MTFDFTDTPGYAGLGTTELVLFHCPEWGIAVWAIRITGAIHSSFISEPFSYKTTIGIPSSCDSLLRLCATIPPRSVGLPLLTFEFVLLTYDWVHLAEVTFYGIGGYCLPDTTLTTRPPVVSKAVVS